MNADRHGGAWATWVAFAGILMITLGIFDVLGGVAALFSDDYFAVTKDGLLVENYKVIGVVHLCFGVLLIAVGWALLQLREWARFAAIVLVVANAAVHVALLNAQPIWSLIMVAIDVLVVYALTSALSGPCRFAPVVLERRCGEPGLILGWTAMLDLAPLIADSSSNLLAARNQMAFTLGFHIILACMGVAFPAIMLIAEYRGRKHGDADALKLAERWSRGWRCCSPSAPSPGRCSPSRWACCGRSSWTASATPSGSPSRSRACSSSPRRSSSRSTSTAGSGCRAGRTSGAGCRSCSRDWAARPSVVAANSWMNQPQGFTLGADGRVSDVDPLGGPVQPGGRLRDPAHDPGRLHGRRASWSPRSTRWACCAAGATATTGSAS